MKRYSTINKSIFLFTPSIVKSVSSLLNVSGIGELDAIKKVVFKSNSEALKSDWIAVGRDMGDVIDDYKIEGKERRRLIATR